MTHSPLELARSWLGLGSSFEASPLDPRTPNLARQAIQGMDVLDLISNKPSDTNDYPTERVVLRKVKIVPRETLPPPAPATKLGEVPPGEAKKSFWRRIWPW